MAPPRPDASISRNAPTSGEPSSVLIAAKLPATPITVDAISGASFLIRCTASTPSPLPIAISGASGPSTAPQHRVAKAAIAMPGSSIGRVVPRLEALCGLVAAGAGQALDREGDERPPTASSGSGHQPRRRVEAEVARERLVEVALRPADRLEEEVRDGSDGRRRRRRPARAARRSSGSGAALADRALAAGRRPRECSRGQACLGHPIPGASPRSPVTCSSSNYRDSCERSVRDPHPRRVVPATCSPGGGLSARRRR